MSTESDTAVDTAARIGLIGDVHAEVDRLERALDHFERRGVDLVLCTGDIPDGPGCVDRCVELISSAGVLCVRGNHDRWLLEGKVRHIEGAHRRETLADRTLEFLHALPPYLDVETSAGCLMLCHGVADVDHRKVWPGTPRMDVERSRELDTLIAAGRHRFLVNGHLHYRMILDFQGLQLVNAGTLMPRFESGLLELDTDAQELAFFGFDEDLQVHHQSSHSLVEHDRRVFVNTQCFDGEWDVFPRGGLRH